jgi:5'-nucleotidase (lipoprotein e(P4) family)
MDEDNRAPGTDEERRRFLAYLVAGGAATPFAAVAADSADCDDEGLRNPLLWAVAWKQTAAEFGAICYQAYNLAKFRLDVALSERKSGDKRLAVITDMDNTIIQAANYWGYLINEGHDFFDDGIWDRWMPKNLVQAVPGSQDFLNYCDDNDVEIFYVSNRDQGERTYEYALTQLRSLKFPQVDEDHVTVNRETSNKMAIKKRVSVSHNLVLMLGDNLNDYKRDYYVADVAERYALMERDREEYGNQFILLPNPTDGHWVRAIFGDSEPEPTDENRRLLKKAATRSAWDGQ